MNVKVRQREGDMEMLDAGVEGNGQKYKGEGSDNPTLEIGVRYRGTVLTSTSDESVIREEGIMGPGELEWKKVG